MLFIYFWTFKIFFFLFENVITASSTDIHGTAPQEKHWISHGFKRSWSLASVCGEATDICYSFPKKASGYVHA